MIVNRDPQTADQESVWDYPWPPVAVRCDKRLVIIHSGITIADTHNAVRTLETSHPPTYYFPHADVSTSSSRRRQFLRMERPCPILGCHC